mmetsp:Transcript_14666/g.41514  ORF Transcript_14666/g.41514 Transcript_14666/m.41514 type:complete len:224 (+) Transcript_14666:599-1270(+)
MRKSCRIVPSLAFCDTFPKFTRYGTATLPASRRRLSSRHRGGPLLLRDGAVASARAGNRWSAGCPSAQGCSVAGAFASLTLRRATRDCFSAASAATVAAAAAAACAGSGAGRRHGAGVAVLRGVGDEGSGTSASTGPDCRDSEASESALTPRLIAPCDGRGSLWATTGHVTARRQPLPSIGAAAGLFSGSLGDLSVATSSASCCKVSPPDNVRGHRPRSLNPR